MAKTAKATKPKAKAAKAASPATPEAPPPVTASPKGEPAGGRLQWRQTSKDTWLSDDPGGDQTKAGGRIKMSTQKWLKGPDADPVYFVYRDGDYLGQDSSLEAAQRRAQYRERSPRALEDKIEGGDMPAFLNLSEQERALARSTGPGRGSSPPRAPLSVPAAGPVARAAVAKPPPGQPPEAQGQPPAAGTATGRTPAADPAQGQPPTAPVARVDVAARVGAPPRGPAAKAPKVRAGKIPGTAIIRVVTKANPRRTGTGQHTRYEQILAHDGKSVAEYVAAGGHLDALTYAVEGKHVTLDGVE